MRDTTTVRAGEEQAHFAAARSWEADLTAQREKSERYAWRIATVASAIAMAAVIGLATLAPFRRNIPYLFALDRATGNVEFIEAMDDRRVAGYQELLDKHWAQRYVVSRESYNYRLLQADYDTVLGMSGDDVGRDFARLYEGPGARDTRFGASVEMRVSVISVQLSRNGAGNQAVVRFVKTIRRTDAEVTEPPQYFVAAIAYDYRPAMIGREKDLLANPLGYRVTTYRVDAELAPVAAPESKSDAH